MDQLKRLWLNLTWEIGEIGNWLDYRREKALFLEESRKPGMPAPIHIEEPAVGVSRHVYDIVGNRQITSQQLHRRWRNVCKLYPEKLTSMLDIGCCRGWFSVEAARRGKEALKLDNILFDYAFLNDVAENREKYHAPFQVILMLNVYHYLYWGSKKNATHWSNHDYLLSTIADLCTERVIFMSPLELADCPTEIIRAAEADPELAADYTPQRFFEVARQYFDVSFHRYLGKRPLYLFMKK